MFILEIQSLAGLDGLAGEIGPAGHQLIIRELNRHSVC